MLMTVLPVPAPPNSPTLPPRARGAIRSTTLMPVSSICALVSCSAYAGGSRWMGQRVMSAGIASPGSSGSPTTLKIRPRVCGPTGTVIGPPESSAEAPRASPSVESSARQRTQLLPRCCCTSVMSVPAPFISISTEL